MPSLLVERSSRYHTIVRPSSGHVRRLEMHVGLTRSLLTSRSFNCRHSDTTALSATITFFNKLGDGAQSTLFPNVTGGSKSVLQPHQRVSQAQLEGDDSPVQHLGQDDGIHEGDPECRMTSSVPVQQPGPGGELTSGCGIHYEKCRSSNYPQRLVSSRVSYPDLMEGILPSGGVQCGRYSPGGALELDDRRCRPCPPLLPRRVRGMPWPDKRSRMW